jgi:hypothetical protein
MATTTSIGRGGARGAVRFQHRLNDRWHGDAAGNGDWLRTLSLLATVGLIATAAALFGYAGWINDP